MVRSNTYETSLAQSPSTLTARDGVRFLLVGGGIGAVLALLFAPKTGREMRRDIADVSRRGYDLTVEKAAALKEQSTDALQLVRDKAEAAYDFAATKLSHGSDSIADAVSTASDAIANGIDDAHESALRPKSSSLGRKPASIF